MAKVKPISPEDIIELRLDEIPDEMIETVNKLIVQNWGVGKARVLQKDIEDAFLILYNSKYNKEMASREMYDKRWMDIEDIYRKKGWKVNFFKPDYTESFDSYFVFEK